MDPGFLRDCLTQPTFLSPELVSVDDSTTIYEAFARRHRPIFVSHLRNDGARLIAQKQGSAVRSLVAFLQPSSRRL